VGIIYIYIYIERERERERERVCGHNIYIYIYIYIYRERERERERERGAVHTARQTSAYCLSKSMSLVVLKRERESGGGLGGGGRVAPACAGGAIGNSWHQQFVLSTTSCMNKKNLKKVRKIRLVSSNRAPAPAPPISISTAIYVSSITISTTIYVSSTSISTAIHVCSAAEYACCSCRSSNHKHVSSNHRVCAITHTCMCVCVFVRLCVCVPGSLCSLVICVPYLGSRGAVCSEGASKVHMPLVSKHLKRMPRIVDFLYSCIKAQTRDKGGLGQAESKSSASTQASRSGVSIREQELCGGAA
jgi:hypothetical protein